MPARLVDLSHPIEHGMVTYPGLPGPDIGSHLTFDESIGHYAEGYEFSIGRMTLVANTGTYLDTPAHRFRAGHDLAGLPLDKCADLDTLVIESTGLTGAIRDDEVRSHRPPRGGAVVFRTGWDRHWGTEAYGDPSHPYLSTAVAEVLVDAGVVLVGIDSLNVDGTRTGERPVHTTLLAAGVMVLEHLTGLDALPITGARLTATPPRIHGLATFPVRAFALVPTVGSAGVPP